MAGPPFRSLPTKFDRRITGPSALGSTAAPVSTPAPTAPAKNAYGNTVNLDPAYQRQHTIDLFKARGVDATEDQIQNVLKYAFSPDKYSDNKWRIGANPYHIDRTLSGSDSADPKLAGDDGVIDWNGPGAPTPDPNWTPSGATSTAAPSSVLGGTSKTLKPADAAKLDHWLHSGIGRWAKPKVHADPLASVGGPPPGSTVQEQSDVVASAYSAMGRQRRRAGVGGRQGTIFAGFASGRPSTAPSVLGGY